MKGLLRPCCVLARPDHHSCCRAAGLPKAVSMWSAELGIALGEHHFQKEFQAHWAFHWATAKEEFAHNQSLVLADWWQIRMRGQLQGLLPREEKGNLVRKASESQSSCQCWCWRDGGVCLKDSQPSAHPGCCLRADRQSFQCAVISSGVMSLLMSPAVHCSNELLAW